METVLFGLVGLLAAYFIMKLLAKAVGLWVKLMVLGLLGLGVWLAVNRPEWLARLPVY